MAANTNNRIKIKWIRDGAKSRYPKKVKCRICGTEHELELHHYTAMTNLLEKWQKETGIALDTDEQVLAIRDRFILEHEYELFEAVVVLCATHHRALHQIYGKSPLLSSSLKQEAWVNKQREKFTHEPETTKPDELVTKLPRESKPIPRRDQQSGGFFSGLISKPYDFSSLIL